MTTRPTVEEAIKAAQLADDRYEAEVHAAGFKSRWDYRDKDRGPASLQAAYRAKVRADQVMHEAFEASRAKRPYVEVDQETAYGSTQRISRSIRVF